MKKQTSAATETKGKGRNIIDYSGKTIFVGIDIHKNDWQVATCCENMILNNHRMTSKGQVLIDYLHRHFPGAKFSCAYECCAWGFNLQRKLTASGIDCIVVHAADLPSTNKERVNKTDKVDARRLAQHLENGSLKAIHVPSEQRQKERSLVRYRKEVVNQNTACRNRIKSALKYHGIDIPEQFDKKGCWSNKFMEWIEQAAMNDEQLKDTLLFMLEDLSQQNNLLSKIEQRLREKMHNDQHAFQTRLATSVPGIGITTATEFLLEIGDVGRFEGFDSLNNYIGFCPGSHDSGNLEQSTGISSRKHNQLRSAFVEAAWVAVRTDPAMGDAYRKLTQRMEGQKAIIRIARKLLRRLRTVLLTGVEYQKGLVA
jgi:transposase